MEYKCNICNKKYKSYKSLWNHNKKFHPTNVDQICLPVNKIIPFVMPSVNPGKHTAENLLICYYCNKTFNKRQSRWRHEKICKNKNQIIELKTNQPLADQHIGNVQTINNGVMNNTENINNGTINKTINKTTNIIKFGSEDIVSILNMKQIMNILNSRVLALEESIKTVHFNENMPEYQNIRINNLRSNVALVHDGETFNVVNQYNAINDLISDHVDAITQLLEDNKDKLNERTIEKLELFVEKIDEGYKKMFDATSNRTYKNYKDYKISKVKEIIYNESKKIQTK
jgi:hypothetical protein